MDRIKESLIHIVGNINQHEENVFRKVRTGVDKKKKSKKSLLPIWIPAIALAIFMTFFAFQIMNPTEEFSTGTITLTKSDYQFLYEQMKNVKATNQDAAQLEFVADIALPFYAETTSLNINQVELNQFVTEELTAFKKSEQYSILANDPNFTLYETIYIPLLTKARYIEEQLLNQLKIQYPSFKRETLQKMLQYNAVQYYLTLEEATMFASKKELLEIANIANKEAEMTITHIEEDYIIAVENGNFYELNHLSPEQIASFHEGVYKIPVGLIDVEEVGSSAKMTFWENKYENENVQEIIPTNYSKSFISFELDYPSSLEFLTLMKNLEWSHFTSLNEEQILLGILFENQHHLIQYNEVNDQYTIFAMLDEQKAEVPKQLNSQLIDIIKKAKYPQ